MTLQRRLSAVAVFAAMLVFAASAAADPTVTITSPLDGSYLSADPDVAFSWDGYVDGDADDLTCEFETPGGTTTAACTSFTPPVNVSIGTGSGTGSWDPQLVNGDGDYRFAVSIPFLVGAPPSSPFGVVTDEVTFTRDTAAPVVTIFGLSDPEEEFDNVFANPRPPVPFSSSDANPTGAATCSLDGGPGTPCTSPWQPTADLIDGDHTLGVEVTDAAGNIGSDSLAFTIDIPTAITFGFAPGTIYTTATPTLIYHASDTAGAVCGVDGEPPTSCTGSFTPPVPLANGFHTFTVSAATPFSGPTTATRGFLVYVAGPPPLNPDVEPAAVQVISARVATTVGRVRSGRFKARITLRLRLAPGAQPNACAGVVTGSAVGRGFLKRVRLDLRTTAQGCIAAKTLTVPARYRGRALLLRVRHPGNAALAPFNFRLRTKLS